MKLSDTVWGAVLLLLSVAILWHIQAFPPMPGQRFGPAVFPGIVASGLGICALLLIASGLRERRRQGGAHTWASLDPWTRSGPHVLALAVAIGVNVFYILLAGPLGFIPTGILYLSALFLVFGVSRARILPYAIIVTLLIHYAFYKLLKVPLPWGILERFAW
ncbi:MAG: tripartite tricarboxylate transporter TctB family protein [Casimicrobiaceae bacterium]